MLKLNIFNYFKNSAEENTSQKFRLKIIDETRNYLSGEINRSELMSERHKTVCFTLNYIANFLIFAFRVTGCVSIFASLVGIPIGITNSAIALEM